MANVRNVKPSWYSKEDESAWERVKDAFRRDWRQTKHDFGGKQPDLNQQVGDTISQAAGSEPIPPGNMKNPRTETKTDTYQDAYEPAYKFGYAAYRHHGSCCDWNDETESKLRNDWGDDTDWAKNKEAVQRGWYYGKNQNLSNKSL